VATFGITSPSSRLKRKQRVERIDRLLFIFWQMQSRWVECERARSATLVAYFVWIRVRWPSGETGALTMRSEKPFWSMLATSKTSKPPGPFAV